MARYNAGEVRGKGSTKGRSYRADYFQQLLNTIYEMIEGASVCTYRWNNILNILQFLPIADAHTSTRHPAKHREQGSDSGG